MLPKTATTSLMNLGKRNYSLQEIQQIKLLREQIDGQALSFESEDTEIRLIIERIQKLQWQLKAVFVMAPYGLHRYLDRECQYITFLREPIQRCLSMWRFLHEHPENPTTILLNQSNSDLSSIIEDNVTLTFSNEMVRMLSGSSRFVCTKNDLYTAKENIDRDFLFVGKHSSLEKDVKQLGSLLGWKNTDISHLNATVTKIKDYMKVDDIVTLADANKLDLALYNWV